MKYYNNDHDCQSGCSCGEDEQDYIQTVMLELEDGSTEECEVLEVLEIDGKEYIALLPLEKEEYYIYGFKSHGDEIEIINIEDSEEFEKVVNAFDEYFNEEDDDFDDDLEDEEE